MNRINFKFPISIYIMILIYSLFAIVFIYETIVSLEFTNSKLEYLIITLMLIYLRIRPINYISRENSVINLTFFFPIVVIYGIIPIIITMLFDMAFQAGKTNVSFTRRYFYFINKVVSAYITYIIIQKLDSMFVHDNLHYMVIVLIGGILYSFLDIFGTSLMIFLEKRIIPTGSYNNILETNIINGVITFFLYLALGTVGVVITFLYAILFSRRSIYKVKYFQTNNELKETEQKLKLIFETIDYGIIMFDMERRIKIANPAAMSFLELIYQKPIGKGLDDFKTNYPIEVYQLIDWTYINGQNYQRKNVSFELLNKDLYFDIYTYPYKEAEGKLAGVILLYKNVSEEHSIKKQLIEADKLSQLGQLAAGKVHEIKNPLTTVKGYLQYLRQKFVQGENINLKHFDIAVKELDRTNKIINSLLILSKTSNQTPEEIELDTLIEEVIGFFNHQISIKNIILKKEIEEGLYILGIENHLKQIFINLMVNAIDAVGVSNNKFKNIKIKTYQFERKIAVEIEDNGVGISADNLEKLHLPFYTTKQKGTGLGLSVTYKLIEDHKGTIDVASEMNKGTKFTITFPAVD